MRFTLPQFIEYEAKIIGPLTFKQFIYFGLAGTVSLFVWFIAPFYVFIICVIVSSTIAMLFAFLKIAGKPLTVHIKNFFKFTFSPKKYFWRKGEKSRVMVFGKTVKKKEETAEDELPLKMEQNSQLKKLRTNIETKTK